MKFRINNKVMKELLEKSVSVINKKAVMECETRLYFTVEEGKLKVTTFDSVEVQLETFEADVFFLNPEECKPFNISVEDVKIIQKQKNDLIIEPTEEGLRVQSGKKTLLIPCRFADKKVDMDTRVLGNMEKLFSMSEGKFVEFIDKLVTFASDEERNRLMQVFNIDLAKKRIVTLDGHRIGIAKLEKYATIHSEKTLNLHIKCLKTMKKLLHKKLDADITISFDGKYIQLEGIDYKYIIRNVEGDYFNIDPLFTETNQDATINRKEWLETFTEAVDIVKTWNDEKVPSIIAKRENLYLYTKTPRYQSLDRMECKSENINEGFTIGFNPVYWKDALSIMESETVEFSMSNPKAPAYLEDDDFKMLILPVNINWKNGLDTKMENAIENEKKESGIA